jgi:hypothetical protein
MATYEVRFDGRLQEAFDDREEAIEWAEEVAETGRVVDVAFKRRLMPPKFVTAFPESERAAREAAWSIPLSFLGIAFYGGGEGGGGGGC